MFPRGLLCHDDGLEVKHPRPSTVPFRTSRRLRYHGDDLPVTAKSAVWGRSWGSRKSHFPPDSVLARSQGTIFADVLACTQPALGFADHTTKKPLRVGQRKTDDDGDGPRG